MFGSRLKSCFFRRFDIDIFQPFGGIHQSAQIHVRVLMFGSPHHALRAAGAGEPDIGMRVLHRPHPGVHRMVLVVLALITKRAGLGPAFDDEVVRLFEALPIFSGFDARLQGLHCGAPHKTGDDSAAGIAIQHRDLFGHADRVVNGNHIAQNGNFAILGHLTDHRGIQVNGRFHAPVGRMVLIAHDAVKAHVIGQGVLLMILIVKHVGLFRIEVGIGKAQTP